MTAIERTAYPRFRRGLTAEELAAVYTPTPEETAFATATARGEASVLSLLVLLKAFQRLGYFPRPAEVPAAVVGHLRVCLGVGLDVPAVAPQRSRYRHHQAIRAYLRVTPWGKGARHAATAAVHRAAQVMDNPADLINAAIEELVAARCELPAFSTLDRLAGHVRALVNGRLFAAVFARLSPLWQARLEALLDTGNPRRRSALNLLKAPPENATLTHLRNLQAHLAWLLSFDEGHAAVGDDAGGGAHVDQEAQTVERLLGGITSAKVQHFAAEAKALDADGLRVVGAAKRATLLLCLLRQAQVAARDDLVEMFLKRIARLQMAAKEELVRLREQHRATTEQLVAAFTDVLQATSGADDRAAPGGAADPADDAAIGRAVRAAIAAQGGREALLDACAAVSAYNGNNWLPLLWRFYRSHRSALFRLARSLTITPTTQDRSVVAALELLLAHEGARGRWLPADVSLAFVGEAWRRLIHAQHRGQFVFDRRQFEVCVFLHVASELRTGDLCVAGSARYADYRAQLLPWDDCAPLVPEYCRDLGLPETPGDLVQQLRAWLAEVAAAVDRAYPENDQIVIDARGVPSLKRPVRQTPAADLATVEAALAERLPERSLLDVLGNAEHWAGWTRHFGPRSGADPQLDRPTERYIITAFGYGCNLGPTQTARHTRGLVTPHMLSFVNRRHVTAPALDRALRDLIACYARFTLPRLWGTGKAAAADGTKLDLYERNLLAEYHIRYGGYGGIAYHHVSDQYVALFSHFIACGVWEAVYIIDGLLKNTSAIQPDTLHADTQGQSTPVFALAHLLGIKLMPRIRHWQDLVFYRPDKETRYAHIDALFGDAIDWPLIEQHWRDLLRVVLSIRAGTVLPSTLLRKLGHYSRKNRLYQAFRELGRVVRTVFLLQYLSDLALRERITAATNKAEAYNGLTKFLFFGGDGVIAENDPEEQEKRIKYTDLVANAVILQNVADMTRVLHELEREGQPASRAAMAALSPYLTRHLKRFGDYVLDLDTRPAPLDDELATSLAGP